MSFDLENAKNLHQFGKITYKKIIGYNKNIARNKQRETNLFAVFGRDDFPFAVLGLDGFFSAVPGGKPGVYVK